MQYYLFVHFREKTTPDGEQVYFGLSQDGFHWETVNDGNPVLWAYHGDKGVRDFTITRVKRKEEEKFYIFATDLSLSYGMRNQYHHSWEEIGRNGSKDLAIWESDDLVNWTEQRMVRIGADDFGCVWAPDIIYDREEGDYMLHWSSGVAADDYAKKRIYYSKTKDFQTFTEPKLLYDKEDSAVIDSAIYEENGNYYMFVKCEKHPAKIILLKSKRATGPYELTEELLANMEDVKEGAYEAPTAVKLEDGRWCLFADFYGVAGAGQGYVPFVADEIEKPFLRADEQFSFPYGFKHGTILTITEEEYGRIKSHDWSDKGWVS